MEEALLPNTLYSRDRNERPFSPVPEGNCYCSGTAGIREEEEEGSELTCRSVVRYGSKCPDHEQKTFIVEERQI